MADVLDFPWPLALACLAHVLAGLLLLLSLEALYVVLLVFGAARLPARIGQPLALLLAALRYFAVIAAMTGSVLAPLAVLHVCRFSSDMKSSLATTLLVLDYAIIFIVLHWLRKKMFPARLKAMGYSYD